MPIGVNTAGRGAVTDLVKGGEIVREFDSGGVKLVFKGRMTSSDKLEYLLLAPAPKLFLIPLIKSSSFFPSFSLENIDNNDPDLDLVPLTTALALEIGKFIGRVKGEDREDELTVDLLWPFTLLGEEDENSGDCGSE